MLLCKRLPYFSAKFYRHFFGPVDIGHKGMKWDAFKRLCQVTNTNFFNYVKTLKIASLS